MSKNKRITIRLTESMRSQIEAQSKKDATDVASFIRLAVAEKLNQKAPRSHSSQ
jgi:Arc/MetJ-type ribon-helix-helix transcriptional regulator